jgi:serine/threonine-protein kinase
MILIPAGYFLMGSSTGQPNERPEHPVILNGFFLDETEVTNAQYRECVADGGCTLPPNVDAFTYQNYRDSPDFDTYPVIAVNWDQANAYCQWAGKRLPTEAEWEYAASGPDNLIWPWGNTFDPSLSAASAPDTQPVGSYPDGASPFGILDMAGNVNEWVADDFEEGFYANSPPGNPVNKSGKAGRIYRGGSFDNSNGEFFTTSRRYGNVRTFSEVDVGFRCAASAVDARPGPALTAEFCDIYAEFRPGAPCP